MTVTTLTACALCGSGDLEQFLDLGLSPIAGDFPVVPESFESMPRYPLRLAHCRACGLAQLLDIIDNKLLYGRAYPYFSGASRPVVDHMAAYAKQVQAAYPIPLREHGIVEIACNDGTFLRHFVDADVRYGLGVEPALGPAEIADRAGVDVLREPFGLESARRIVDLFGKTGVIVGNNVLAHISDLDDFLAGVKTLLHQDGVAIFEVQYLPDLLTGNAFDLVYHEHHYFWSVRSLGEAFARHSMAVVDVQQHGMQGGSIRVFVRHAGPLSHSQNSVIGLLGFERQALTGAAYVSLQPRASRVRARLWAMLEAERAAGRTVAAYGASAKATTLFAHCDIDSERVAYAVDTTPIKWGRYMPGTDIPIVPAGSLPDGLRAPDTYLLTVPNYLGTFVRNEHRFLGAGGRAIVPLPVPAVI
jgi:hypothetical protein